MYTEDYFFCHCVDLFYKNSGRALMDISKLTSHFSESVVCVFLVLIWAQVRFEFPENVSSSLNVSSWFSRKDFQLVKFMTTEILEIIAEKKYFFLPGIWTRFAFFIWFKINLSSFSKFSFETFV